MNFTAGDSSSAAERALDDIPDLERDDDAAAWVDRELEGVWEELGVEGAEVLLDEEGVETAGVEDAAAVDEGGGCGRDSDWTGVLGVALELVPGRDPGSVLEAFDPDAVFSGRRIESGKGRRELPRLRPRNVRRKLWYLWREKR